jgi:DNA replication and repair protein RecF
VRSAVIEVRLTDFRSYGFAALRADGRSVYLFGPNGAGKTNLLEALSLLSPGRGLRGAAFAEMGRRAPGEPGGGPWTVSVDMIEGDEAGAVEGEGVVTEGLVTLGVGLEARGSTRRVVRIDGEPASPGELSRRATPIWLTPAQDRLFLDGAAERRRFLDRLVFAGEAAHALHVAAYERALRWRAAWRRRGRRWRRPGPGRSAH